MSTNTYANKTLFGGNREIAIERDGNKCVECCITREEHRKKYGRDITVDHIDGKGRNTPIEQKNNELSNLMTLCVSCHGRKDGKRSTGGRGNNKITEEDVSDIRMFIKHGIRLIDIARLYPITPENITHIKQRKIWRHIP